MSRFAPILAALLLGLAVATASAEGPVVEYDHSPNALILRFEQVPGELDVDRTPTISIWGDGRMVVTRPSNYVEQSEIEVKLASGALDSVLVEIAASGVLDFDAEVVRKEMEDRRAARIAEAQRDPAVMLKASTDAEVTRLEVHVQRYFPEGADGPSRRDVDVDIRWVGLRGDVWAFPDATALAGLKAAQASVGKLAVSSTEVK
jgi:hypothetical protein